MPDFDMLYHELSGQITKPPIIQKYPIILYGCGEQAKLLFNFCNYYGIKISGFADRVKHGKFGDTQNEILSPSKVISEYPDAVILIASWKFDDEIFNELIDLGYPPKQIIRFPFSHPYILMKDTFEKKYFDGYKWAYYFFKDDLSKKIIMNRICAYLLDQKMNKTSVKKRYFEFLLSDKEVFVQAGCYTGDTVIEFIEHYTMKPQYRIYTFEADPQALEISRRNLAGLENVHLIPKGLWSSEMVLTFHTDSMSGGASFVNGSKNEIRVPVTSLDIFFADKPKPTFIQLDIEGAELEALKGAESIIRNQKPKLAICVYHKYEDIYEIPLLISKYNPDYKFWLQHCEDGVYDTVLYAI